MIDVTQYKPSGDKLLIKLDPVEEKTPGGIIKPQARMIDLASATVIDVSDGFYGQEGFWVDLSKLYKPGDKIIYQHGVAAPVEDQPEYAYLQMAGVLGIKKECPEKDRQPDAPGC